MPGEVDIILASSSPRRRELVERLGLTYQIIAPALDETAYGMPAEMVAELCERKARAVYEAGGLGHTLEGSVVLAADTLVALDGRALGKPNDPIHARVMLQMLSGRAHEVYTGVCMIDTATGRMEKCVDCTKVFFRALTAKEIQAYVDTGEPLDKAGAYGIQGGASGFVERIVGSYTNVMGLPTERIVPMLLALRAGNPSSKIRQFRAT